MSIQKTFDQFLVDADNRYAFLLCQDAVQTDDPIHAPVYLCGPSGCGKTHLLRAVEQAAKDSGKAVRYVTADQLVTELVDCINNRVSLSQQYHGVEVLLVDDLHVLIDREKTIQEVHHLFFWLQQNGCRIVMACTRNRGEAPHFVLSLAPLILDGVTVKMDYPKEPLRRRFLMREAQALGLALPEEVVDRIVRIRDMDCSTLSGILKKMHLSVAVDGQPINLAWCDDHM